MKKKWILIAIAAVVLIALIVVAAIIAGRGSQTPEEEPINDPTSRYPYTVDIKDGSATVTITGEFGDYTWKAAAQNPDAAVQVTAGSASATKAEFTITPVKYGADMVFFTLEKAGTLPDIRYVIDVPVIADDSGAMTVLGSTARELGGCHDVTGGAHPYSYAEAADGTWLVAIGQPGDGDWFTELAENRYLQLTELEPLNGALVYRVTPTEPGQNTVWFCDMGVDPEVETVTALEMQFTINESKFMTVGVSQFVSYNIEARRQEAEHKDRQNRIEEMVGGIAIPEPLELTAWDTGGLLDEAGTLMPLVWAEFTLDGVTYTYYASQEITEDIVAYNYALADAAVEETTLGETAARVYSDAERLMILWNSEDGDLFWLVGTPDSRDGALRAAAMMNEANPTLSAAE